MPEAVNRNNACQPKSEVRFLTRVIGVTTMAIVLSGCQSLVPQDNQKPVTKVVSDKTPSSATTANATKPAKSSVEEPEQEMPVTDLWVRTRQGLGLNLDNNDPRILTELRWYRNNQSFFDRVGERASPYFYFIVEEAEKRDVPLELALLPVVESTFDPFAYSHAGASGLWQFMPATGEHYGLKQNWWYDGRRDVVAATRAALDYMVNLNKMFNDWELALAAFNSGPGRVLNAVKKNRKAKKPTDFWSLDLPKETTAYVPKLVALGKIVRNPKKFGVKLKPLNNIPYFAKVKTGGQLDMAKAARLSGVPLDKLYKLNPGINRWSTPPSGPHHLLVPITHAQNFRTELASLPMEKRLQWRRYSVASGDSLLKIAKNFRTQVKLIKEVNKLDSNIIRIGQNLLIPVPAKNREEYSMTSNQRQLARQNRKVNGRHRLRYQVKSGDSFWTIARKYNTGVNELARWNNLSPRDMLRIGQELVVWTKTAATKDSIVRKVRYTVRQGDSLARIADKFNVNVGQLKVWNSFDSKYIHPGQMITLYVDVTRLND